MDGGGVVTVEGFGFDSTQVSDSKLKDFGSGFLKHERSDQTEEQRRAVKFLKVEGDFCVSNSTPLHHGTPVARSERILSFSSLKPEMTFFSKGDAAGYGLLSGSRGPFTPSQWIELEHQALIYKYLIANVPIPSNLLLPLKRSFNLHCLSSSASGFHPNSLGWGSFHLGLADPDLGRCRRTDGKKWRCSKEAVADQKYCEKHMNRGRHRSRKPVEGQNGHAAASSSSDLTNPKMVPLSSSTSASVISNGGGLNFLSLEHTQFNNPTSSSANVFTNRIQDPATFTPFEESIQMEFRLPPYTSSKSHGSFLSFGDTKDQSDYSIGFDPKPDWTQLSMSIPVSSTVGSAQKSEWAASMGGPLGEVLTNTSVGSSPTGVLQKGYFCSGSNSSSASSPVAQNRTATHENLNICDDDSNLLCP